MKHKLLLVFMLLCSLTLAEAANATDSLLVVLDNMIAERKVYTEHKEAKIKGLKREKRKLRSLDLQYQINAEIISNYESFVCDSAERYINENITIAQQLGNDVYLTDSRLKLAFVYSLSGLFVQANRLFELLNYDQLNNEQKVIYCWNRIRYYENLIKYTNDHNLSLVYIKSIDSLRDAVIELLPKNSAVYFKEYAFKQQELGYIDEAIDILLDEFEKQTPATHQYAMAAMSLARAYRIAEMTDLENKYLKLAAITDIQFSVKENEALLALALNLFETGDITRSYNYISAALSDANFYNSRFKNTVIARVQPVIESNYLLKIEKQKQNLRLYAILISIFVIALIITFYINFRQMKIVSKARRNLRAMNGQLIELNHKLTETNIVKEKYIGYFMNQCALYVNKLHDYRKDVNHKIKNGQIDRLYKPSANELDREINELHKNFDEAFLNLYPNFVSEFNSLLEAHAQYEVDGKNLNTELRIFAMMRLGIVNINQIAEFLHCSIQTVYNYKSKMKNKVRKDISDFEEAVAKLGLTISQPTSLEFTKSTDD